MPRSNSATVAASEGSAETNVDPLLCPVLVLLLIGFSVWLLYAATGYARRYASMAQGWQLGGEQLIEMSAIRGDIDNLACASDVVLPGNLRCAQTMAGEKRVPAVDDDRQLLRPHHTVNGELFLASGLWSAPDLRRGPLPKQRFTIVCKYHVVGVLRSVLLRWSPEGPLDSPKQSLAAGYLTDCAFPP